MSGKTFIDTNVLIYAHDVDAKDKHQIAREVLLELWEHRTGVLSTQVLHEFYVNVTRKISTPLSRQSARVIVNQYLVWCVENSASEITAAFRIEDETRISFWDALIIAAALKAGAERILSEDLNSGQSVSGIRIENPFKRSTSRPSR
jgi:predicted nucleic acid-binding protein